MLKNIIIPTQIDVRLDDLTKCGDELTGVLLYKSYDNNSLVESLLLTGLRHDRIAFPYKGMVEVADIFLKKYKNYRYIEFHTHTNSSSKKGGYHLIEKLYELDNSIIQKMVSNKPDYLYLLVTPGKKIFTSKNSPKIIVENLSYYDEKIKVLNCVLKIISHEFNYDFDKYQSIRQFNC